MALSPEDDEMIYGQSRRDYAAWLEAYRKSGGNVPAQEFETTITTTTTSTTHQKSWDQRIEKAVLNPTTQQIRDAYRRADKETFDSKVSEVVAKATGIMTALGITNLGEIFGRDSSAKRANELCRKHPDAYRALRVAAQEKGLL